MLNHFQPAAGQLLQRWILAAEDMQQARCKQWLAGTQVL